MRRTNTPSLQQPPYLSHVLSRTSSSLLTTRTGSTGAPYRALAPRCAERWVSTGDLARRDLLGRFADSRRFGLTWASRGSRLWRREREAASAAARCGGPTSGHAPTASALCALRMLSDRSCTRDGAGCKRLSSPTPRPATPSPTVDSSERGGPGSMGDVRSTGLEARRCAGLPPLPGARPTVRTGSSTAPDASLTDVVAPLAVPPAPAPATFNLDLRRASRRRITSCFCFAVIGVRARLSTASRDGVRTSVFPTSLLPTSTRCTECAARAALTSRGSLVSVDDTADGACFASAPCWPRPRDCCERWDDRELRRLAR